MMGSSSAYGVIFALAGLAMAAPQGAPEIGGLGSGFLGSGDQDGRLSIQNQIYIISGTFGGLLLLLILLVLALALAIARMKRQLGRRQDNYLSSDDMESKSPGAAGNNGNINAYVNEGFITNSHEMEERGSRAPRFEPQTTAAAAGAAAAGEAHVNRMGYEVYQASGQPAPSSNRHSTENRGQGGLPRASRPSSDHQPNNSRMHHHHQLNMEESVAPRDSPPTVTSGAKSNAGSSQLQQQQRLREQQRREYMSSGSTTAAADHRSYRAGNQAGSRHNRPKY